MGTDNVGGLDLAGTMVETAPRVDEGIVAALQAKAEAANEDNPDGGTSETDSTSAPKPPYPVTIITPDAPQDKPEAFDPAIHEVDESGNPRLTKDGKFRRKRGGGAKKAAEAAEAKQNSTAQISNPAKFDYAGTATLCCNLVFGSAIMFMGEDWKPNAAEEKTICDAAARYFESMGWGDIPPGIALCVAVGMYALPRWQLPSTKARLAKLGLFKAKLPVPSGANIAGGNSAINPNQS